MIGSPERVKIQRSSIPKLGRFIAALGSYMSKLSKQSILAKKWPNFRHLRIFLAYKLCGFLKEDHKGSFHTKNYESL